MTAPDLVRLCGAAVRRCQVCQNTLGDAETGCRKCGSTDIDESATCRNPPLKGANRCRKHGGRSPQALARAESRVLETEARSELARLGAPEPIDHPVTELLAVAAERKAWLAIIRRLLPQLDSLAALDSFGVERARGLVALYTAALDDSQRSLEGLIRLDLDARRLRLSEYQAGAIVAALEEAINDSEAALTPTQRERVRAVMSAALAERAGR